MDRVLVVDSVDSMAPGGARGIEEPVVNLRREAVYGEKKYDIIIPSQSESVSP